MFRDIKSRIKPAHNMGLWQVGRTEVIEHQ